MHQGIEVAREENLLSIQEKMKSFSNPLMQCGVSELTFQTVFKYFSNLCCDHNITPRMSIVSVKASSFIDAYIW
jgi:hypothetical protein